MTRLTEAELAAVAVLASSSMGCIPLQGYSLSATMQHYESSAGSVSRRAFEAVERQFWKKSTAAGTFSSNDLDVVRDAAWHKATHPVKPKLTVNVASSMEVREMLIKAGWGQQHRGCPWRNQQ